MCGFVGVVGAGRAAPILAVGLGAIQHRGQDAAGIATWDQGALHLHKDLGMVDRAVPPSAVAALPGEAGVGHVRYPTLGGLGRDEAQPFVTRRPGILLAHNGNLTNRDELVAELEARGLRLFSKSDSELLLLLLAEELTRIRPSRHGSDDLVAALQRLYATVRGSYSVAAVLELDGEAKLVCFRDPWGIRPAAYGRAPSGGWMVASETVALDVTGFESMGFVPPGAVAILAPGQEAVVREVQALGRRHCIFEQIYFARADSVTESGRVNARRWALGERLADEWSAKGHQADVIVAIPDTSRPAAMAMSERLGIPHREGFIKNRYTGRTFIMPDQVARETALRSKLNPIREVFEGKRVVLVDDSVVRGSTMRRISKLVRQMGPAEVHIAIFSPPVRHACFYGIDIPSREELVAASIPPGALEDRLSDLFDVDSVTFLSAEGLAAAGGRDTCAACFTGEYVVPVSDVERARIVEDRPSGRSEVASSGLASCRV